MALVSKSTIVRSIQVALKTVNLVSPGHAAQAASWLFFKAPTRQPLTPEQEETLSRGQHRMLETGAGPVHTWSWGSGPRVVLQHGWGGWGAQLQGFVQPLVDAGYEVVTFDGPGHGATVGTHSSFPAMAEGIRALAAEQPLHALVAHSLGCCASLYALDTGVEVEVFVGIAGAAHPLTWFDEWVGAVVSPEALQGERERLRQVNGWNLEDLDTATLATRRSEPMLWVHDVKDKEVPFESGPQMVAAWPGAHLLKTEGLGHRRILRDPDVIRSVLRFIVAGSLGHLGDQARGLVEVPDREGVV